MHVYTLCVCVCVCPYKCKCCQRHAMRTCGNYVRRLRVSDCGRIAPMPPSGWMYSAVTLSQSPDSGNNQADTKTHLKADHSTIKVRLYTGKNNRPDGQVSKGSFRIKIHKITKTYCTVNTLHRLQPAILSRLITEIGNLLTSTSVPWQENWINVRLTATILITPM